MGPVAADSGIDEDDDPPLMMLLLLVGRRGTAGEVARPEDIRSRIKMKGLVIVPGVGYNRDEKGHSISEIDVRNSHVLC